MGIFPEMLVCGDITLTTSCTDLARRHVVDQISLFCHDSRGGTTGCESFCVRGIGMQLNRANPGHKSTSVRADEAHTDIPLSCT